MRIVNFGIRRGAWRLGALAAALGLAAILAGCGIQGSTFALSTASRTGSATATWTYTAVSNGDQLGTITLNGSAGTVFPSSSSDYSVKDTSTGVVASTYGVSFGGANSVTVDFGCAQTCPADGDGLALTVVGVHNPPAGTYPAGDFAVGAPCPFEGGCLIGQPSSSLTFSSPIAPLGYLGLTTAASDGQSGQTVDAPQAAVGSFFFNALQAQGGIAPYVWSLQSGSLPPGLRLYASGALLGVPTTAGTYQFTARVSDDQSMHWDESVTIVVR